MEPDEGTHWDDDQAGGWDEFLATPPARSTEPVLAGPEEQEPLFSLNPGRLGWLLSEYTDEPDPLPRIHQLTHNLAERERSHPVLSQQFQELLMRAFPPHQYGSSRRTQQPGQNALTHLADRTFFGRRRGR